MPIGARPRSDTERVPSAGVRSTIVRSTGCTATSSGAGPSQVGRPTGHVDSSAIDARQHREHEPLSGSYSPSTGSILPSWSAGSRNSERSMVPLAAIGSSVAMSTSRCARAKERNRRRSVPVSRPPETSNRAPAHRASADAPASAGNPGPDRARIHIDLFARVNVVVALVGDDHQTVLGIDEAHDAATTVNGDVFVIERHRLVHVEGPRLPVDHLRGGFAVRCPEESVTVEGRERRPFDVGSIAAFERRGTCGFQGSSGNIRHQPSLDPSTRGESASNSKATISSLHAAQGTIAAKGDDREAISSHAHAVNSTEPQAFASICARWERAAASYFSS